MARTRRPSYLSPFALARRNAIYKGVLGGDRKWLIIGGTVWGARSLRKALGKNEQIVAIEKMEPGQWMSLRTIPPITRKEKKSAKRATKSAKRAAKRAPKPSTKPPKVETSTLTKPSSKPSKKSVKKQTVGTS